MLPSSPPLPIKTAAPGLLGQPIACYLPLVAAAAGLEVFSDAAQPAIEDERGENLVDGLAPPTRVMSDSRPGGGIEGESHLNRDRRGVSR